MTPDNKKPDKGEATWAVVGTIFLFLTASMIVTNNGTCAIAAAIVFATCIYAYRHSV